MNPRDLSTSVVEMRLRLMHELLADLGSVGVLTADDLHENRITRRAVERLLTQLVELAADINQHVVVSLGELPSMGYRESFALASRHGLIPPDLARKLEPSVGLRNVLTHEYVNIDLERVAASIPMAVDGYGEYVRAVANWIADREGAQP